MRAFLVAHRPFPNQRLHFVDELYVDPSHRRKGYATFLLSKLSAGPIELRVRKNNTNAFALYSRIGMCELNSQPNVKPPNPSHTHCTYPATENSDGMCMRSRNFVVTKRRLSGLVRKKIKKDALQDLERSLVTHHAWNKLPANYKTLMVDALMRSHDYTERTATENLRGEPTDKMLYLCLP
jgi:hypothetical protein